MYTTDKMGSRCEVVTQIETPRTGLSDGNPSYGSVTCYMVPKRDQVDLSNRSLICRDVHVYVSTHTHTWVHWYACGLSKVIWITRVLRVEKRVQDRYSEMDVCT